MAKSLSPSLAAGMPAARLPQPGRRSLAAIAIISAAGLAWEVDLTRLASVVLAYHYAFVAVSLAISGLGLGAALLYALPQHYGARMAAPASIIAATSFLLAAVSIPTIAQQGTLAWLILITLLPFLALGAAMAAVFRAASGTAWSLYGADLLGAGVGSLGSVAGLNWLGPFGLLLALAALSAAAAGLFALDQSSLPVPPEGKGRHAPPVAAHRGRLQLPLAALLLIMCTAGLILQVISAPLEIAYANLHNAPPDKTIVQVLQDPTQHARIVDSRWDAFARTDVVATTTDPSRRLVFTDGGGGTYMLAWNGKVAAQEGLRFNLETLPFLLGRHDNVLIIGAGGGIDVVRALVVGARHVTAVEVNGATVAAVRAARGYNGNVLDRPGVTAVVDDARHFLAGTHQHFDTILLNLVYSGAAEGTSHALAESYIFTTQALRLYLDHLTPRGRIGIISHQALEGIRAFTTGVEALHQNGETYSSAMARAAVLMTANSTPESRPTLTLLQNMPVTQEQADVLHGRALTDLHLQEIYLPHYYSGSVPGDLTTIEGLFAGFLQNSDYGSGDYAINPTDDNRPFFFDFNYGLPEGLSGALLFAALLAGTVVTLVLFLREGPPPQRAPPAGGGAPVRGAIWSLSLYVTLLGVGFMCVEVPVIQRFILLLGQPVLALTVVLATLLVAGGCGSLLGARLFSGARPPVLAPLLVAALVLLALLLLPIVQSVLLPLGLGASLVGAVAVLVPLGLALGLPFPLGLRLAARFLPGDVALFWSLNALFSVLGSVLAAVIAVQFGFNLVLIAGIGCYVLAAASLYPVVGRRNQWAAAA